jgi:hypothetical protein
MRILDRDEDKSVERVSLFLTESEARQIHGYLEDMLAGGDEHHAHIYDEEYQREVVLVNIFR